MKNIQFLLFFWGALLAIGAVYLFQNQDYREKQRRLINKVLLYVVKTSPRPINTVEVFSDQKYEYYSQKLDDLKKKGAPEWQIKVGRDFTPELLPPEALTIPELKARAEKQKDPDACLFLATRGDREYPFHLIHNGKKWLKKAIEMKRPGAEFLWEVVLAKEKNLPRISLLTSDLSEKDFSSMHYDEFYQSVDDKKISGLPGYQSFLECIRQGDTELYKTLLFFEPGIERCLLGDEMDRALKKKEKSGDKTARRIRAELVLRPLVGRNITRIMQHERNGSEESSQKWRALYNNALKAARELKELAAGGDTHAMYLWLKYGLRFEEEYDRQTWENLFEFTDILLCQGYAGVLEEIKTPYVYGSAYFDCFPWGLVKSSYTDESCFSMARAAWEALKKRRDTSTLYEEIWTHAVNYEPGKSAQVEEKIKLPILGDEMAAFLQQYGIYRILLESNLLDKLDRESVMDFLNEQASEGYPEALLALGDIWRRGSTGRTDMSKAQGYFEAAWPKSLKYNTKLSVFNYDKRGQLAPTSSSTREECASELMRLYLLDFPSAANEANAFELAKGYTMSVEKDYNSREGAFFLLGQLYEKGIGTEIDVEKAVECYKKGVLYYDESLMALQELCEQGRIFLDIEGLVKKSKIIRPFTNSDAASRLKVILNTWKRNEANFQTIDFSCLPGFNGRKDGLYFKVGCDKIY